MNMLFFLLYNFIFLVKNQVFTGVWINIGVFDLIPFVYLSVLMPIQSLEFLYPIYAKIFAGLILYRSCTGNFRFCEFLSVIAVSCPEEIVSRQLSTFSSSFQLLFHNVAWSLVAWLLILMFHLGLIRSDSYSLYFNLLFISVLTSVYFKKVCLCPKLEVTQIYRYKCTYSEGHWTAWQFSKMLSGFSLREYELSSYRAGYKSNQKSVNCFLIVVPVLHHGEHLAWHLSVIMISSVISKTSDTFSMTQMVTYTFYYPENWKTCRQFLSQFEIEFSVFYSESIWCLLICFIVWLLWVTKGNDYSLCSLEVHRDVSYVLYCGFNLMTHVFWENPCHSV